MLTELASDTATAADVRVAATGILAPRTILDATAFDRLTAQLNATGDPLLPVASATALGSAKLSGVQRQTLIQEIAKAGPLTLPLLVKAFYKRGRQAGMPLAKALVSSPGARALPEDELEQIFGIAMFQRDANEILIAFEAPH